MEKPVYISNGVLEYRLTTGDYLSALRAVTGLVASVRRQLRKEIEIVDLSVARDEETQQVVITVYIQAEEGLVA